MLLLPSTRLHSAVVQEGSAVDPLLRESQSMNLLLACTADSYANHDP